MDEIPAVNDGGSIGSREDVGRVFATKRAKRDGLRPQRQLLAVPQLAGVAVQLKREELSVAQTRQQVRDPLERA